MVPRICDALEWLHASCHYCQRDGPAVSLIQEITYKNLKKIVGGNLVWEQPQSAEVPGKSFLFRIRNSEYFSKKIVLFEKRFGRQLKNVAWR